MIKRLITIAALMLVLGFTNNAFASVGVTFQVDMGVQMQLGNFNPATDSVVVRGDFQTMAGDTANWYGAMFLLTPSVGNDSIYTLTVTFPDSAVGVTIQYKYVIIHNGTDNWESVNNRTYTITSSPTQTIPLVYFNDVTTVGATLNITFEADMTNLLAQGFIPGSDSIEVMGSAQGLTWTPPGAVMAQDLINPDLFSVTVAITASAGDTVQWKFHGDPTSHFTNGGWENGDNHKFAFPSADTTIGPVVPNMYIASQSTGPDTVYFRVDMNGARNTYNDSLITGLQSVWLGGSTLPLQWPTNWVFADTGVTLIRMYDDGTHGDSIAGDNIYSNVEIFATGSPSPVDFKYGAVFPGVDSLNGGNRYLDNEAGMGINHELTLIVAGGTVYQFNHFGDQVTAVEQQTTNTIPKSYTLSQNYPNPFNPTTKINYSIPKSSMVSLKIYNILGQEVATLVNSFQHTGKYKATFDATRLASGIYFYRLQAGNVSLTKKMILMK